jgi:hypothetical protein
MPRKAKTQTGRPAQPTSEIPGQYYGAHTETQAMQELLPTPDNRAPQPAAAAGPPPSPASGTAPAPAPAEPVDLMAIAQRMAGGGGLLTQPGNPETGWSHGLSRGPGPGPEVVARRNGSSIVNIMERIGEATGDPYFMDLARRVAGR